MIVQSMSGRTVGVRMVSNIIYIIIMYIDIVFYIPHVYVFSFETGSIRFKEELDVKYNGGLSKAIVILEKIKIKYDRVSWADLIQMAGAVAVELAGGPAISMVYGRKDCLQGDGYKINVSTKVSAASLLSLYLQFVLQIRHCPAACAPFPDASSSPDIHIRNLFYRLGFTNQEAVALLGAHTLGRAFSERTGVCTHSSGEQGGTQYTRMSSEPMVRLNSIVSICAMYVCAYVRRTYVFIGTWSEMRWNDGWR